MGTWKSRGLRGSLLEDRINQTVSFYREKGLALIQKIPTPITPLNIDKQNRQITLAYFNQKSTVDYMGIVQGIAVCFDAKECSKDSLELKNLHPHQFYFMRDFEIQGGVSFLIISFTMRDEIYYLPFRLLSFFWKRMEEGGRKSFRVEEIDPLFRIRPGGDILVHFLKPLQLDLNERAE